MVRYMDCVSSSRFRVGHQYFPGHQFFQWVGSYVDMRSYECAQAPSLSPESTFGKPADAAVGPSSAVGVAQASSTNNRSPSTPASRTPRAPSSTSPTKVKTAGSDPNPAGPGRKALYQGPGQEQGKMPAQRPLPLRQPNSPLVEADVVLPPMGRPQ